MNAWEQLIVRYADGRKICNCGGAYYDETGHCAWGCQANLYSVKADIARRVLAELGAPSEPLDNR
jgi:hypothetical protein